MRVVRTAVRCALACTLALASLLAAAQKPDASQAARLKKADAAFHAGYAAQQSGNLELARSQFAEVVRLAPQIAEAHEALGAVLLEMNRATEAVPELETAARMKPGEAGNEANLALAYAAAGNAAKAISHFDAAVQAKSGATGAQLDARFYDSYARALAAVGRPKDAIAMFVAEEGITGPRADLEDAIGSVYAQQKEWNEARQRFEHALALDPTMGRAQVHLGVALREQRDVAGSAAVLAEAVKSNPADALALFEYGETLVAAGRDEEAIPQFEAALKANAELPGGALEMAMALQRLGRQQEAIPWFEKAVAVDQKNASALTNLGLALTLTGQAKEALAVLDKAEKVDAHNPAAYKDMGIAHVQLSAFDEAIADFEKALTLDANDSQLHYDLGLAYKFKDRYEDAIRELSRAGEMDPTLQDPPYTLGILLMQMGKLDEAVAQLKKAVALRPESGDAWAILGSTLKQDGRLPEAADALRKAIPLQPGQPGPRVTLAGVLAEEAGNASAQADAADAAGDAAKAAELRKQMAALRTEAASLRKEGAVLARSAVNRQKSNFAMNAGNQLMLRGEIADAIARYQEAIAADGTFAAPHAQLAIAYERQGRAEEAEVERKMAQGLGEGRD